MKFLEDLPEGYRSHVGDYLLTEDEVVAFATRWDPQPFHIDPKAAKTSIFGGLTASSLHLFAICTRLFFDHEDPIRVLAMMGKDKVRFPNPARPGDELRYHTEVLSARPSASKPDRGIVVLADTLANQHGEPVMTQEVTLLVAVRGPHQS